MRDRQPQSWSDCMPSDAELEAADKEVQFGEPFTTFSDSEKDLMIAAVALLQQNADILQHACCVAYGPNSDVCSCVMDYVTSGGKKIDMRRGKSKWCDQPAYAGGAYGPAGLGDNIHFCDCIFETFSLTANSDDSLCAMMSIAMIIFQELVHSCGWSHPEQGCDAALAGAIVLSEGLVLRCNRDTANSPCVSDCAGSDFA